MRMFRIVPRRLVFVVAAALAVSAGCTRTKSSNPLSQFVAGPMEGITVVAPKVVEPSAGQKVKDSDQPLAIVIENAQSNIARPLTMAFQIAADEGFSSVAFAQNGITPSGEGLTRLRLPDKLQAGRTYYLRLRADDGANTSGWSAPAQFEILQPIVIGTANPLSPTGGERVSTQTPELRVANGVSSGPFGSLFYNFQVAENANFAPVFANAVVNQGGGGETRYTMPPVPGPDRVLYWRVRISDGPNTGAWSRVETLRTPVATGGGSGPTHPPVGGGGTPGSCATNNGDALVKCIEAKYPSYLAAGVSGGQREANMEFLRDRIIESGICGGLDLAWNKKRGNGPHSIDALAWRMSNGVVEVVDIGVAYDDTSRVLGLSWNIVTGPPGYDTYQPRPNCGG